MHDIVSLRVTSDVTGRLKVNNLMNRQTFDNIFGDGIEISRNLYKDGIEVRRNVYKDV